MKNLLAIGLGSGAGGILRYLLSVAVQLKSRSAFPYGTLSVNVIGCLAIGIVFGLADRQQISGEWRLYLATGLIGGFTTFSAFSLEAVTLLREGRAFQAAVYVTLSFVLGLLATFSGLLLARAAG